jgi:hypothetical protein
MDEIESVSSGDGQVENSDRALENSHIDRYGFYITDDNLRNSAPIAASTLKARKQKEAERASKWVRMIKKWDKVIIYRQQKLKRRVRKGIPDVVRGYAWFHLSGGKALRRRLPALVGTNIASIDERTADEVRSLTK